MSTQTGSTEVRTEPPEADGVGERPMRADARRNRELLVAAARTVFSTQGAAASMEAIAKEAGVGVGTLYRHFPNRLDLVEAVYQTDVEELSETAQRVAAELAPWPAVEAFFEAFLRYANQEDLPGRAAPGVREEPGSEVTGARPDRIVLRPRHRSGQGRWRRARGHRRLRRHATGEPGVHEREHRARTGRSPLGDDPRRITRRPGAHRPRLTTAGAAARRAGRE